MLKKLIISFLADIYHEMTEGVLRSPCFYLLLNRLDEGEYSVDKVPFLWV